MIDKVQFHEESKTINELKDNICEPHMFHVIFLNDDYTPMDFVTAVLQEYFGKSDMEAYQLMMEVHEKNEARVGTYTKDIALTKCKILKDFAKDLEVPLRTKLRLAT